MSGETRATEQMRAWLLSNARSNYRPERIRTAEATLPTANARTLRVGIEALYPGGVSAFVAAHCPAAPSLSTEDTRTR